MRCNKLEIVPAIDISGGKCVRLFKGKKGTEKVYYENPLNALNFWIETGVKRIHIVDLDGAWGSNENKTLLKTMIKQGTGFLKIQIGGGIRSVKAAQELVNLGVDRIIIGTLAVKNPEKIEELANKIGSEHVIVAVDYKKGKISTHGWTEQSKIDPFIFGKTVEKKGAGYILFSSVEADGAFTGPDIPNIERMINHIEIPVYAAGGVRNEQDLIHLKHIGTYGVIIGKAFYEEKLSFDIIQKY